MTDIEPWVYWLTMMAVGVGIMVYCAWVWAHENDNPVERFIDQRRGLPTEEEGYPNVWRK